MDGSRFDRWTRTLTTESSRRRALQAVAGGILAGLLAHLGREEAIAACTAHGKPCRADGRCCSGDCKRPGRAKCAKQGKLTGKCRCRCRPRGAPCTWYDVCCSQSCDFRVDGGTCSPCRGRGCASSADCCGGLSCQNSYCGGCRDRAVVCGGPSDCCFSDCANHDGTNLCLSKVGGRCERDVDCYDCYMNFNCDGACSDGHCTV